ncbi:MAG: FliH/SctL family protein [Candidatus Sericytochromatia bacterium]|nr:FliH/SctL family protein [Candidatus Sericytochromatia bacterium]
MSSVPPIRPKIIKVSAFEDGTYTIRTPGRSAERPFGPAASRSPEPQVSAAQDKASAIIALAEEDAEQIRQVALDEGRARGHAEGYAMGLEEAKRTVVQEYGQILGALSQAIAQFHAEMAQREDNLIQELSKLSIAIAAKLLPIELAHGREAALPLARVAIQHLIDKTQVRLRVHPLDMDQIVAVKQQLMLSIDGLNQLDIVPDSNVGLGGCLVESRSGLIDARLSTQLAEVATSLLDVQLGVDEGSGVDPMVAAAVQALGHSAMLSTIDSSSANPAAHMEALMRRDAATQAEAEARARQVVQAAQAEAAAVLAQAQAQARALAMSAQPLPSVPPPAAPAAPPPPAPTPRATPAPAPVPPAPPPIAAKREHLEAPLGDQAIDELLSGVESRIPADQLLPNVASNRNQEPNLEQATDSLARMLGKKKTKSGRGW